MFDVNFSDYVANGVEVLADTIMSSEEAVAAETPVEGEISEEGAVEGETSEDGAAEGETSEDGAAEGEMTEEGATEGEMTEEGAAEGEMMEGDMGDYGMGDMGGYGMGDMGDYGMAEGGEMYYGTGDPGMGDGAATAKAPLLSKVWFIAVVTVAVLIVGIGCGILLGRAKIKKGINIYE
ncbi:MAG TPA: hypothetical protein DEO62_03410 [Lachnospiraceae bacterium]|nr:hypothetical protein [Lachnospiraceae bacterium]HBZ90052.1 hypothetical protein [Lachnospiraceae bacterium]